jgi:hypothetical protein
MRQSFSDMEQRLAQNAADLRSRREEMRKLRVAVKRAEASFGGSARLNGLPARPRVIAPSIKDVRP